MTPRERAEATADKIIEMLKDAWGAYNSRESDGPNVADMLDAFAAEHVRALLAETPETMELLTYGPLDEEDARWTLATLRRKALGE